MGADLNRGPPDYSLSRLGFSKNLRHHAKLAVSHVMYNVDVAVKWACYVDVMYHGDVM